MSANNANRIAAAAFNLVGPGGSNANRRDHAPLAHALCNLNGDVLLDASSNTPTTQAAFLTLLLRQTVQALTDAATIVYNVASGLNATVTLAGNRTLALPTNARAGDSGEIIITQDGTGNRTLAYAAGWLFPGGAPTASTAAAAKDVIRWHTPNGAAFYGVMTKAYAA